jgi:hypothetical protein
MYNTATGELVVDVGPEAQALLFQSDGLFNLSASPLLGSLAPAQFDTDNLMFFNDDNPLPTGRFSLGPILPPGLAAADVSLATKGNGIAVDLPVAVVPEGTTALLAGIGGAVLIVPRRRRDCPNSLAREGHTLAASLGCCTRGFRKVVPHGAA